MFVINNKKIFFGISITLVVLSIVAISVWGLNLGIDFTGGSILEVNYKAERPDASLVNDVLVDLSLENSSVRGVGDSGYLVRTRFLEDSEREALVSSLAFGDEEGMTVERFNSIGPTIGAELRSKAIVAIVVVVLAIVLFVAFVFRKVSKPVSSWKYGIAAIVALVHDIVIPTGVVAALGYFTGASVDSLFIMALLAILGFSVNDTIVVFDRIRENLKENHNLNKKEPFGEVVGRSLSQTYTRSLNTSITTLVVLIMLFMMGGSTIHSFVLTLIVGVVVGTYSSIFLASPLLVLMAKENKS